MNKKISVIVPIYNASKYLKNSLDSILNQTYKNLEIILVDDGSQDNSKQIIKDYANKDSRIIPFYSEINKGVSYSRNIGLKFFSGDYALFMDSDDFIEKKAIEKMLDLAIKYDADMVDSYELIIFKKKNKIYKFTENKIPKNNLIMGNLKENQNILTKYTYIKGKLYRKDLLKDLFFDENLPIYEDMVFEHQIKNKLKNYVFMNEVVYYYYQIPESLINSLGKKHLYYLDAAKKVNEVYKNNEVLRNKMESILVTNFILTLLTKIVKNNDSIEQNCIIVNQSVKKLIEIFPNYQDNKNISFIIKKMLKTFLTNYKKTEKIIRITKNIDFINLYFSFLYLKNRKK